MYSASMVRTLPTESPTQSPRLPAPRLHELDSIRGLAAMCVVFTHFHDMWSPYNLENLPKANRWRFLLLSPFYTGHEAVILFFLLSGLVLSLPFLRGKRQNYLRFVARRIVRIYGPYLAALLLAVMGAAAWHNHRYHGEWATALWSIPVDLKLVAQHVAFLGVYDWHQFNFAIWSLIHELRISLLFPLLFLLVSVCRGRRSILIALCLSAAALRVIPGQSDISFPFSLAMTAHYVGFFLIGILLASTMAESGAWWKSLSELTRWIMAAAALMLFTFDHFLALVLIAISQQGRMLAQPNSVTLVSDWFTAAGSAALIIIGLNSRRAGLVLNSSPARFLGKISYSLYLVHPVVLLGLTFAIGDRFPVWLHLPLFVGLAITLGWLFNRTVEEPCIRLSRAI